MRRLCLEVDAKSEWRRRPGGEGSQAHQVTEGPCVFLSMCELVIRGVTK